MKTSLITFALSSALCVAAGTTAWAQSSVTAPVADTVMLSETTDGDFIVRRYLVKNNADADYQVRYQINMATLSSTFDDNSRQIDALGSFIGGIAKDTLNKIQSVDIAGYSSPDGPVKFNETLARNRAVNFKNYADRKFGLSNKYAVKVTSEAEDWAMCRALVAQSSMPDKQAVLNIIDSRQSADAKEMALKRLPAAWNYMKQHILPPLRRVEVAVNYGEGRIVEQRMRIAKPAPAPKPTPEPAAKPEAKQADETPYEVIDENITGIIVEMPAAEYRKDVRAAEHQARQAEKQARKELREARKVAKKEAKAAKKAEKLLRDAAE